MMNLGFNGKDVAEALGYSDTAQAIRKNISDEDKMGGLADAPSITDSMGRTQYPVWINESGLYSLILSIYTCSMHSYSVQNRF